MQRYNMFAYCNNPVSRVDDGGKLSFAVAAESMQWTRAALGITIIRSSTTSRRENMWLNFCRVF